LAGVSGEFSLTLSGLPPYPYLAAATTDPYGTTSELSDGFLVSDGLRFKAYLPIVIKSL